MPLIFAILFLTIWLGGIYMDTTGFISEGIKDFPILGFITLILMIGVFFYAEIKKTSSIEKEIKGKSSQQSVDTLIREKASQESVDTLKANLDKVASQQNVDTLKANLDKVASQQSVDILMNTTLKQETFNLQFNNLKEVITRNQSSIDTYLTSIQNAKTDSENVQKSIATFLSVMETNGRLNLTIHDLEKELENTKALVQSLQGEIKIFKAQIELQDKQIELLKTEKKHILESSETNIKTLENELLSTKKEIAALNETIKIQNTKQHGEITETHDDYDDYQMEM